MSSTMTRRFFLRDSAIAAAGMGLMPTFLARVAASNPSSRNNKILIAIFQRGAADGLNMVVPYGEKAYYKLRPSIAIPAPNASNPATALDLDGFFGLHPSLAPFKPLFDQGHLAIVHAAGSPDSTRSHFDAQDFMETATPGLKGTTDGWLNRHLASLERPKATPFRAVALGPSLPRSLRGRSAAVAMTSIEDFSVRGEPGRVENVYAPAGGGPQPALRSGSTGMEPQPALRAGRQPASAGGADLADMAVRRIAPADIVTGAGKDMLGAVEFLKRADPTRYQPAAGVEYPRSPYGNSLRQIAQLVKANVGLEVAFADTGGWDTHANQGGAAGQLANRLTDFAQGISALYADLGDRMQDVVILTMSEFGRTAAENGNRGTDHGHANAMFLLGGGVKGGRIHGKWPGLEREQLNEGRDLALTTDFRDVFAEVISLHLGNRNVKAVFPGFVASPKNYRGLVKV